LRKNGREKGTIGAVEGDGQPAKLVLECLTSGPEPTVGGGSGTACEHVLVNALSKKAPVRGLAVWRVDTRCGVVADSLTAAGVAIHGIAGLAVTQAGPFAVLVPLHVAVTVLGAPVARHLEAGVGAG